MRQRLSAILVTGALGLVAATNRASAHGGNVSPKCRTSLALIALPVTPAELAVARGDSGFMLGLSSRQKQLTRTEDDLARVNQDFDDIRPPAQLSNGESLLSGKPLPTVFISVHQSGAHQQRTADTLASSAELTDVPRLFIVNETWPIENAQYRNEASVIRYSAGGEGTGVAINADLIVMAGGSCGGCLTRAMKESVTKSLVYGRRQEVAVRVLGDQSFGDSGQKTLMKELRERHPTDDQMIAALGERLLTFTRDSPTGRDYEEFSPVQPGTRTSDGFEFKFKRNSDQKIATIVFTDP